MRRWHFLVFVSILIIGALLVAACTGTAQPEPSAPVSSQGDQGSGEDSHAEDEGEAHEEGDEHTEEAEHTEEEADDHSPDEHVVGAHDVPETAAEVPNPIAYSDESVAAGGEVYTASCVVCHGENGEGDGPTAAALESPPADLHASHVQELSDGALFYIITHGRPDTPMPAWEDILDEEERWNVVNFIRTFQE